MPSVTRLCFRLITRRNAYGTARSDIVRRTPGFGSPVGAVPDIARSDADETPTGIIYDSHKPAMVAAALLINDGTGSR